MLPFRVKYYFPTALHIFLKGKHLLFRVDCAVLLCVETLFFIHVDGNVKSVSQGNKGSNLHSIKF